jgi:hypothetical protein
MASTLSPGEKAQLEQTIEMFEVITQSQPQDCQSLEILKEAYTKLEREPEVVKTSKRIAEAYVQLGQLSSAILEYETILQSHPNDPDVQTALKAIESKASNLTPQAAPNLDAPIKMDASKLATKPAAGKPAKPGAPAPKGPAEPVDDGSAAMRKIFVDSKIISPGDFDLCWQTPDPSAAPPAPIDPFIQLLADKGVMPTDKSLKTLVDKSRLAFLPLEKYDIDADLTRKFPVDVCRRWCVLPFDRMSKSILVATANPYNKQAARELAAATQNRLVWYLASPADIINNLKKVFR